MPPIDHAATEPIVGGIRGAIQPESDGGGISDDAMLYSDDSPVLFSDDTVVEFTEAA